MTICTNARVNRVYIVSKNEKQMPTTVAADAYLQPDFVQTQQAERETRKQARQHDENHNEYPLKRRRRRRRLCFHRYRALFR